MTRPRISYVKDPQTGIYEVRPFVHPLVITHCPECGYRAVSVSQSASNDAIWAHYSAIHLCKAAA